MNLFRHQIHLLQLRHLRQSACFLRSTQGNGKPDNQTAADSAQTDTCPPEGYNSLFLQWLKEWDSAYDPGKQTRAHASYRRAIESLRTYQMPLRSAEDALKVPYIGKVISGELSQRLMLHKFHKCANPLFVKWLMKWKEEAEKKQSETRFGYGLVIQSLLKYPHPLESARAAVKKVEHLSEPIAIRLDEKLKELSDNGCDMKCFHSADLVKKLILAEDAELTYQKTFDPKKKRAYNLVALESEEYIPQFRTGAFALLLTLHEDKNKHPEHSLGYMTKPTLTLRAQPLCDWSFQMPGPLGCWSSMDLLIEKGLVLQESGDNNLNDIIDTVRDVARFVGTLSQARYIITRSGSEAAGRTEKLLIQCFSI